MYIVRIVLPEFVNASRGTGNVAIFHSWLETIWLPRAFGDSNTSESDWVVFVVDPAFKLGSVRGGENMKRKEETKSLL